MEKTVKQRLVEYLQYKGIGQNKFESMAGISKAYIYNLKKEPSRAILLKILSAAPDLNKTWLLTGEGDMIKSNPDMAERPTSPVPPSQPASTQVDVMQLLHANQQLVHSLAGTVRVLIEQNRSIIEQNRAITQRIDKAIADMDKLPRRVTVSQLIRSAEQATSILPKARQSKTTRRGGRKGPSASKAK